MRKGRTHRGAEEGGGEVSERVERYLKHSMLFIISELGVIIGILLSVR